MAVSNANRNASPVRCMAVSATRPSPSPKASVRRSISSPGHQRPAQDVLSGAVDGMVTVNRPVYRHYLSPDLQQRPGVHWSGNGQRGDAVADAAIGDGVGVDRIAQRSGEWFAQHCHEAVFLRGRERGGVVGFAR